MIKELSNDVSHEEVKKVRKDPTGGQTELLMIGAEGGGIEGRNGPFVSSYHFGQFFKMMRYKGFR